MPSDHHGFIPSSEEDLLRRRVKVELRKRMRGLRNALPATACAERSARIVLGLRALPVLAAARAVALFWPMLERREVDLRDVDVWLRNVGCRVAYPVVDQATGAMAFRFVDDVRSMKEATLGFREPPEGPEVLPGELDAIVVPALAVDARGYRIGYGAGFYDRALPSFAPPASSIAVAFDFQLVAEVPETQGDTPVGWVVTDARSLATARL
ncbi:MAG TPA: 5-formyltetrahydrofolate cyclo-ligase [Polyangiaceae bacterium]|nr:5-formyltetrahydrofolate cyclo-ligase [Polyangiaceae bacterium]